MTQSCWAAMPKEWCWFCGRMLRGARRHAKRCTISNTRMCGFWALCSITERSLFRKKSTKNSKGGILRPNLRLKKTKHVRESAARHKPGDARKSSRPQLEAELGKAARSHGAPRDVAGGRVPLFAVGAQRENSRGEATAAGLRAFISQVGGDF